MGVVFGWQSRHVFLCKPRFLRKTVGNNSQALTQTMGVNIQVQNTTFG